MMYNLESGFSENARSETIRNPTGVIRAKPQTLVDVRRMER